MATYNTDTATYRVTYLDENGAEQFHNYKTQESAASAANDMAMEGTIVLRITRH